MALVAIATAAFTALMITANAIVVIVVYVAKSCVIYYGCINQCIDVGVGRKLSYDTLFLVPESKC